MNEKCRWIQLLWGCALLPGVAAACLAVRTGGWDAAWSTNAFPILFWLSAAFVAAAAIVGALLLFSPGGFNVLWKDLGVVGLLTAAVAGLLVVAVVIAGIALALSAASGGKRRHRR